MLEIRNRKTLQSKIKVFKSDVKIGDCVHSLPQVGQAWAVIEATTQLINPMHSCCSGESWCAQLGLTVKTTLTTGVDEIFSSKLIYQQSQLVIRK